MPAVRLVQGGAGGQHFQTLGLDLLYEISLRYNVGHHTHPETPKTRLYFMLCIMIFLSCFIFLYF